MVNFLALLQGAPSAWDLDVALLRLAFLLLAVATLVLMVTIGLAWTRGHRA